MKRKRGDTRATAQIDDSDLPIQSTRKSGRISERIVANGDPQSDGASSDDGEDNIVLGSPSVKIRATPKRATPGEKANAVKTPASRTPASRKGKGKAKKQDLSDQEDDEDEQASDQEKDEDEDELAASALTQSNRPKGRRKCAQRTPTPPRTLPPHEHYFFAHRPGGQKTSNNTLSSVSLLSHEDYFSIMKNYRDPHRREIEFLHDLHSDSYDQWAFELENGFNLCLYGWGSKRRVLEGFADWSLEKSLRTRICVLNGFAAGTTVRDLCETLAGMVSGLRDVRLPANPTDALQVILGALGSVDGEPHQHQYFIIIHSLDAPQLRRPPAQSLIARLAAHPVIHLLASCDTTTFPVLWDNSVRTQFNWVYHDTTTFAAFDAEIGGWGAGTDAEGETVPGAGVVDTVNALLGRSGRKVHGREGVVFVLRSLTESARRLYGLLVAEVLSADEMLDDVPVPADADADGFPDTPSKKGRTKQQAIPTSSVSVEYRSLYRKAVQSLIATSEMQFRQLLKEFYDHEMLVSKKDGMGTELLSLPFRKEELESILEEVEVEG